MLKRRTITLFLSVLFLTFALALHAKAAQVSGYITTSNTQYFLTSLNYSNKVEIKALNSTTQANLKKLKNGDLLVGTGEMSNGVLVLSTVDFVGLRELLGLWITGQNYFNFLTFSTLEAQINDIKPGPLKISLEYSIAPGVENEWRIFFSDKNEVLLGILTLKKKTALFQFIDSETGSVSRQIELKKVSGPL